MICPHLSQCFHTVGSLPQESPLQGTKEAVSIDHLELSLDPTAALRTVLKWISDSLSSEDVEAIAYINGLPGPAKQHAARTREDGGVLP